MLILYMSNQNLNKQRFHKFIWKNFPCYMGFLMQLFQIEIPSSLRIFRKVCSRSLEPNSISSHPIIHKWMGIRDIKPSHHWNYRLAFSFSWNLDLIILSYAVKCILQSIVLFGLLEYLFLFEAHIHFYFVGHIRFMIMIFLAVLHFQLSVFWY